MTLDEGEELQPSEVGLLSGKFFTVAGFADMQLERLKEIIVSSGGKFAGDKQIADFAIFPMDMLPDSSTQAKEFVRLHFF